jgi:hypothetical protein
MVEPYRHLRLKTMGRLSPLPSTPNGRVDALVGFVGRHRVAVKAQIDIRPIPPPWENGSTSASAGVLSTQEEAT